MSNDVGLQRAILASIQTARSPPPRSTYVPPSRSYAPAPRRDIGPTVPRNNPVIQRSNSMGSAVPKFSSSRVDAIPSGNNRRFGDYKQSPQSRSTGQAMGTLAREGFTPSAPSVWSRDTSSGGAASPPGARSPAASRGGRRDSDTASVAGSTRSRVPAPTSSTAGPTTKAAAYIAPEDLATGPGTAAGWARLAGKGAVKPGEKDPKNVVISSDSPGYYVCTSEGLDAAEVAAVRSGDYTVTVEAKVARANVADEQFFYIVLAARTVTGNSTPDFTALCVNTRAQTWSIQRMTSGALRILAEKADKGLKPNEYRTIAVHVSGATVAVTADGKQVFGAVDMPDSAPMSGPVGVAVYRSKVIFRDWAVTAGEGDGLSLRRREIAPYTNDDPELIECINRDVILKDLGVTFDDIASLANAKRLLNEAVVLPMVIPEFFTGIREPWKGVLLFGPPGTGKTMLAKAVAGMAGTTFFNCTSSTLVSKWRGDSEKLVRCLFNMARHHSPSIVFFDEFDSLMSSRGNPNEHEASRRFKSELLTQMDGLLSKASEGQVMVLATSNSPWDLDEAMRRRLEKRIYIPIPDQPARKDAFELILKNVRLADDVTCAALAKKTETFSGADIHLLCREASMMGMRKVVANKTPLEIKKLRDAGALDYQTSMSDFEAALKTTQSSVCVADINKFEDWNKEFGSV